MQLIKLRLISIITIVLLCGHVHASIILSENFDSWPTTYADEYPPSPWVEGTATGSIRSLTLGSVTHSPYEVTAPGRGGAGKSMKTWRNGTAWTGNTYYGSLWGNTPGSHQAIYMRWYMRTPSDFNPGAKVFDQKLFRLNTSGASANELYFTLSNNNIYICPNNGGADCQATPLNGAVNWRNGEWHAHQLYINLVTRTVTYWVDGVQTYNKTGVANMPSTSDHFAYMQHFPVGNTQTSEYYQTGWREIDVDDLVFATTKEETDPDPGGADITPPSISNGIPTGALSSGSTFVNMTVATSEAATCKFSTTANVSYASMANTFTTTGGASHAVTVSGLEDGGTYNRYVRCIDTTGNANTSDYIINWSVSMPSAPGTPIFSESFETAIDNNRGWYDGTATDIVTGGQTGNALRWAWTAAGNQPAGTDVIRQVLPDGVTQMFLRAYVKFDVNWRGSGVDYHPHLLHVLSNQDHADSIYSPIANSYLNLYFEGVSETTSPYRIRPAFFYQDKKRTNHANGTVPLDLRSVTENRSTGYCNQPIPFAVNGYGDCYDDGTGQPFYSSAGIRSAAYEIPKGQWVQFDTWVKLNTVSAAVGQPNGEMKMWVDGTQVLDAVNVTFRTNQNPTMTLKQLVLAPWIGDGSPITQTMYIDELAIYDTNIREGGVANWGSVLLGLPQ